MTQLDKEALVLFKDYSLLQLKSFRADKTKQMQGKAGGAVEPYEFQVISRAENFHRIYIHIKLNSKKDA